MKERFSGFVLGLVKNTGLPIDGHKLYAAKWVYTNYQQWHLYIWPEESDEAVMKTYHQKDELYQNMPIKEFEKLWKSDDYEPPGTICIKLDQFEVLK